jgi:glycosyltransferase involved in cell wall biosynthesis
VARFLGRERPDVVHLHKVKRLSPALFVALRWARVRVVATHHDHALTCLNSSRVLGDGRACPLERCRAGFAIEARCVGGSRALTAYAAIEFALRRHVVRDLDVVGRHAFPSRFLLERTLGTGLRIESHVVPNFAEDPAVEPDAASAGEPPRVLYFGRLSEEKGVALLPEIARRLPGVRLRVVGDGPMRAWLDERARAGGGSGLEVVGPASGAALHDEVRRADVVVLPSVCQENAPLAAIEAMAAERPIVAARIGGLPELVADGRTGLLHEPGDAADAARQVARLLDDPALARRLGEGARAAFEARHTAARHLERTLELYDA